MDYNLDELERVYPPGPSVPSPTTDLSSDCTPHLLVAAYAHSKTANIGFANQLDRRYLARDFRALFVHPNGIAEANFSAHHDPAVLELMNGYVDRPHIKNMLKSTAQGAASAVLAAVGKDLEGKGCIRRIVRRAPAARWRPLGNVEI